MAYSKSPSILGTQANGQGNTVWDAYSDPITGGYQVVDISKQLGDSTGGYSVSRIVRDMIRLKNSYVLKINGRRMGKIEMALWTEIVTKKVNRAQQKNQIKIDVGIKPLLLDDNIISTSSRRGQKNKFTGPDYQASSFTTEGIFEPVLLYIDSKFPSNDIAGDVPENVIYAVAQPLGLTQAFIAKSVVMNVIKRHHRSDYLLLYVNSKTTNMASKDYVTGGSFSMDEKWGGTSLATGEEMLKLADDGKIGNFMEFKVIEAGHLNKQNLTIIEIVSDFHIDIPPGQMKISEFMQTYYPAYKGDISKVKLDGMKFSGPLQKGDGTGGLPVEWHVEYGSATAKSHLQRAGWIIIEEFSDAAGLSRGEASGWAKPPERLNLNKPLLHRLKRHGIDGVKLTKKGQAKKMGMGDYPIKQTIIFDHAVQRIRSLMKPSPHYGMYAVSNTLKVQAAVMADAGISVKDGLLVRKNVNSTVVDRIVNQIIASEVQEIIDTGEYVSDKRVSDDIVKFKNKYQFDNEWVILKLNGPVLDDWQQFDTFQLADDQGIMQPKKPVAHTQHYIVTPKNIWPESVLKHGQIYDSIEKDGYRVQRNSRPLYYSAEVGATEFSALGQYNSYMQHPFLEFTIDPKRSNFELKLIMSNTDLIKANQAFYEEIGFTHFSYDERSRSKAEGRLIYARIANEMKHAMFGSDLVKDTLIGGGVIRQSNHSLEGIVSAQRFWQEVYSLHAEMNYGYLWNENVTWRDVNYQTEIRFDHNNNSHRIVTGTLEGFASEALNGKEMRERFMHTGSLSKEGILVLYGDADAILYDKHGNELVKRKRYEIKKLSEADIIKFVRPFLTVNSAEALKQLTEIQRQAVAKANSEFKLPALTSHNIGDRKTYNVSDPSPGIRSEKPIGKNGGIAYMSPREFLKMAFPLEYDLSVWSMEELNSSITQLEQDVNFLEDIEDRKGLSDAQDTLLDEKKQDLKNSRTERSKIESSARLYKSGAQFDAIPQFNIRYDPAGGIEYGRNHSTLGTLTTKKGEAVIAHQVGKWFAHDGRHRALAMAYGGVKLMPVLFIDSRGNPVDWQELGKSNWPEKLISEKYSVSLGRSPRGQIMDFPINWEAAQPGGIALPHNVDNTELKKWVDGHKGPMLRSMGLNPQQQELTHLAVKFVDKYGKTVKVSSKINIHPDWIDKFGPLTSARINERIVLEINEAYGLHERYIASNAFGPISSADMMIPYTIDEFEKLKYTSEKVSFKGYNYTNHQVAEAVIIARGRLSYQDNPDNPGRLGGPSQQELVDFIDSAKIMKEQTALMDKLTHPIKLNWEKITPSDMRTYGPKLADIDVNMTIAADKLFKLVNRNDFMSLIEPAKIILKKPIVIERRGNAPSNPEHLYSATQVNPDAPIGKAPDGVVLTRYIIPEGTHVYLTTGNADLHEVLIDGNTIKEKWTSSSAKKWSIARSHTYDYVKVTVDGKMQFHDSKGKIIKLVNPYGPYTAQESFSIGDVTIESITGQGVEELWETFKKRVTKLKAQIIRIEKKGGYVHPVMQDYVDKHHQDMQAIDRLEFKAKAIRAAVTSMHISLGVLGIGGKKMSTRIFTGGIFLGASVFFQEHYFNRAAAMAYDEEHPDQEPTWTDEQEQMYQRYDWMWGHIWLTKVIHRAFDNDLSSRGILPIADAVLAHTGAGVTKAYNELTGHQKANLWLKERIQVYNERWAIGETFAKALIFIEPISDLANIIEQGPALSFDQKMRIYKPELWRKYKSYILTTTNAAAMAAECEKLPEDTTARARCELKLKLYNDATDVSSLLENPPFSPQELGQLYSSGFNVKTGKPFENGEQYDSEFARKWRKKMRSGGGVMYGNGDSQGTKFWKDILGK